MFTELKGKVEGLTPVQTDYLGGFRLKFTEGMITGYMTSKMLAFGTYQKVLEGGAYKVEFNSMIDFMNKGMGKKCNFGVSLTLGPG